MTAWQYARDERQRRAVTARRPDPASAASGPGPAREVLAFASPAATPDVLVRFGARGAGAPDEVERELAALASAYGPRRHAVHLGANALESHLRDEMSGYAVVHLAAPGALDNASPLFSYVLLASAEAGLKSGATAATAEAGLKSGATTPQADVARDFSRADPGEDDGVLEAWELLDMSAAADLVICTDLEWPAGTLQGAEGITGHSWAWLVAGVPATVVSRWPAPAPAREILLAELHRALAATTAAAGRELAQALRDAMLAVMRTPGYDAPLHWAGFMMVGDPD